MAKTTEDLGNKHREFVPLVAAIEKAEEQVGQVSPRMLRLSTTDLHESIAHGLIPHAIGEGRTVFPVLRRVTGSDEVATEMNRQHREIGRLTDELERIRAELAGSGISQEPRLREVLHGLRRTLDEHFKGEEEACFAVLKDELGPEEARGMLEAMERAAAAIGKLYE